MHKDAGEEHVFNCGAGLDPEKKYTCEVPLPEGVERLKVPESVKENTKAAMVRAAAKAAKKLGGDGGKTKISGIKERDLEVTRCGVPNAKIKMRLKDRTLAFKNVKDACECKKLCKGEDAWMFHTLRNKCYCRGKPEDEKLNRAVKSSNYISSYGPVEKEE